TTCAALAAGLKLRTVDDLKAGRAATWDVVGDLFASRANVEVPAIDPKTVGNRLSTLAASHDLTVFETFLPDLAGHGRIGIAAAEVVRRLDQLMAGVLAASADQVTVLLTSDHGNFEQRSTRSHTRNQVPWLTTGPFAHCFTGLGSLADVAPRILEVLSAVPGKASS
ncbi:MAG: metalloenzyme, partial [Acidobacteriota bacterium]|nr:metalloenzyme [Acidobacteriota bacterium]